MRAWMAAAALAVIGLAGCTGVFGRQYEYEEQWTLSTDGSAVVVVDSSIAALIALHGLPFDPNPLALVDQEMVRRAFEQAGCQVETVSPPWRRSGRRFVQVRLIVPDVRQAGACRPLAWATYSFKRDGALIHYHEVLGAPTPGDAGRPDWNGSELVAIKLHLPSKIREHNVKLLDTRENGTVERGNILTWEQHLAERRAGAPLDIAVTMDAESILYRTLWLFAGAFAAAVLTLLVLIWWTVGRGRKRVREQVPRR